MIKFFDYCFYRIHYVYVKRKIDSAPRVYSTNWVSFGQICNILIFIQLFCFVINVKFEIVFAIPLYIIVYGINYFIIFTKKKYDDLAEKHKKESYKKLKGWGVFLYLLGSLIIWLLCNMLLKNAYSNYNFDLNVIKHLI